jgi:hypothetical protein
MTPSVKASSSGRLSADRSGGVLTHRLNPRLVPVRIRKIVLAVDHPHSVTFQTHRGEPLTLCQPNSAWTDRPSGGRSADPELTHDLATVPGVLPLLQYFDLTGNREATNAAALDERASGRCPIGRRSAGASPRLSSSVGAQCQGRGAATATRAAACCTTLTQSAKTRQPPGQARWQALSQKNRRRTHAPVCLQLPILTTCTRRLRASGV